MGNDLEFDVVKKSKKKIDKKIRGVIWYDFVGLQMGNDLEFDVVKKSKKKIDKKIRGVIWYD